MLRTVSALFVVFALGTAHAEDFTHATVTPVGQLQLFDSPPGGFLRGLGNQTAIVNPGESYFVLQQVSVPTLVGPQDWLQIQSTTNLAFTGWVNGGPSGAPSPNLRRL